MALAAQTIPPFTGEPKLLDGTPCMPVKEFCERVDAIHASTGTTPAQVAAAVKQKLTGAAYNWLQVQVARGTDGLNRWTDRADDNPMVGLKTQLMREFQKTRTPGQIHAMLATLKQRSGEGVQAFFRRVELVTYQLNDDVPEDERRDGAALYERMNNRDIMQRFLMGVPKEMREYLMEAADATPDRLRESAVRRETARHAPQTSEKHQGQGGAIMEIFPASPEGAGNATQNSLSQMAGEIAALKKQLQRANSTSNSAGTANPAQKADISSLPSGYCHYCSHEGHKKEECRKKKADEQNGIFRQVHNSFKNGGKPRRPKKASDNTGSSSAGIAEVSATRQPTMEEMAAAYWQMAQQGNIAAFGPPEVQPRQNFFEQMPPLN